MQLHSHHKFAQVLARCRAQHRHVDRRGELTYIRCVRIRAATFPSSYSSFPPLGYRIERAALGPSVYLSRLRAPTTSLPLPALASFVKARNPRRIGVNMSYIICPP